MKHLPGSVASMSLSPLLSRLQRYPKPESEDELNALIVLNAPTFKALATELVALPPEALVAGCQEVLDTLSQPSSPYSVYTQSPSTQDVALPVKQVLCQHLRDQGSEQQVETAIHVFSRLESVKITPSRPRIR
jgi:hypothetical protein